MHEPTLLTGWILFAIGLYSLAASILELRRAGSWEALLQDMIASPAGLYASGLLLIAMGTGISATQPFTGDWRNMLVAICGWGMLIEGTLFIAAPDLIVGLSAKLLGDKSKLWALATLIFGIGIMAAAYPIILA